MMKMNTNPLLTLLLLLWTAIPLYAQHHRHHNHRHGAAATTTPALSGHITDSDGGQPLDFAAIYLDGTSAGA